MVAPIVPLGSVLEFCYYPQMFSITDLSERIEFAPIVADRVWRAWWKPKGYSLSFVEQLVQQNLKDHSIPFAIIAHNGTTFLGTASVIASDLDARPQYFPWVAAVWVDEAYRSNGIGSALVRSGAEIARNLGVDPVYLCALPHNHGFYQHLGWRLIEENVTEAGLAVFRSR